MAFGASGAEQREQNRAAIGASSGSPLMNLVPGHGLRRGANSLSGVKDYGPDGRVGGRSDRLAPGI